MKKRVIFPATAAGMAGIAALKSCGHMTPEIATIGHAVEHIPYIADAARPIARSLEHISPSQFGHTSDSASDLLSADALSEDAASNSSSAGRSIPPPPSQLLRSQRTSALQAPDLPVMFARPMGNVTRDLTDRVSATNSNFVVFPENSGDFDRMYGHEPTQSQISQLSYEQGALTKLANVSFSHTNQGKQSLIDFLEKSDTNFVTIIGHNLEGTLSFPNGERLALSEISTSCSYFHRKCIILSCNSSLYIESPHLGLSSAISFEDAALIAGRLNQYFAQVRAVSYYDLEVNLPELLKNLEISAQISTVVGESVTPVFGFLSVGAVLVSIETDSESAQAASVAPRIGTTLRDIINGSTIEIGEPLPPAE